MIPGTPGGSPRLMSMCARNRIKTSGVWGLEFGVCERVVAEGGVPAAGVLSLVELPVQRLAGGRVSPEAALPRQRALQIAPRARERLRLLLVGHSRGRSARPLSRANGACTGVPAGCASSPVSMRITRTLCGMPACTDVGSIAASRLAQRVSGSTEVKESLLVWCLSGIEEGPATPCTLKQTNA